MNANIALAPDLLGGFAALLQRRSGLSFSGANLSDLENGVVTTSNSLGFPSPVHFFQLLNVQSEASAKAFETLVRAVTIGETYFFRYPEQFTVLREDILPELIARKRQQGDLSLRLWSAGCSTGEEPYSLCLTLLRLLPDVSDWRISVLATDINRDSLERAARAEYSSWSFRGVETNVRQSFFEEVPRPGGSSMFRFYPEVRKQLQKWVHFQYLNLKDHCYPSLLTQTTAMDFIFCRNVLIYFSHEVTRDVVRSFHTCLSDGSYLMVGPVEPNERTFRDFRSLFLKGTMLYQRAQPEVAPVVRPTTFLSRNAAAPRPQTLAPPRLAPDLLARGDLAWRQGRLADARELFSKAHTENERSAEPCFRLAVLAADRGEHDNALTLCRKAIDRDSLDTRFYQLMSIVEAERGDTQAAITALRKAVFLDRDFVMGHFGLAVNFLKVEEPQHAERHLRNCLSLLASVNDDDILPGVEEIAAGWLKKLVQKYLKDFKEMTRNRDEQKNTDRRRYPHHS